MAKPQKQKSHWGVISLAFFSMVARPEPITLRVSIDIEPLAAMWHEDDTERGLAATQASGRTLQRMDEALMPNGAHPTARMDKRKPAHARRSGRKM